LAELREGVWMRPDNVELSLPESLDADLELMTATPQDPRALSGWLWDLSAWSARAGVLLGGLNSLASDRPEALASGFELSAAVLRHLQADPLLPTELLPADWPGPRLRAVYDEWDARYRTTLREWSRADRIAAG
jgi:phenylacetic acid degradation operon negative regulatory protein